MLYCTFRFLGLINEYFLPFAIIVGEEIRFSKLPHPLLTLIIKWCWKNYTLGRITSSGHHTSILQVSAPHHVTPFTQIISYKFHRHFCICLSLPTTVAMHVSSSEELVPPVDLERSYDETCVAVYGYLTSEL